MDVWNVVQIVSSMASSTRLTPALPTKVAGAVITSEPSSVVTRTLPFDTTQMFSNLCILPTPTIPAGKYICLAYTPFAKKCSTNTSTCSCFLQVASSSRICFCLRNLRSNAESCT